MKGDWPRRVPQGNRPEVARLPGSELTCWARSEPVFAWSNPGVEPKLPDFYSSCILHPFDPAGPPKTTHIDGSIPPTHRFPHVRILTARTTSPSMQSSIPVTVPFSRQTDLQSILAIHPIHPLQGEAFDER